MREFHGSSPPWPLLGLHQSERCGMARPQTSRASRCGNSRSSGAPQGGPLRCFLCGRLGSRLRAPGPPHRGQPPRPPRAAQPPAPSGPAPAAPPPDPSARPLGTRSQTGRSTRTELQASQPMARSVLGGKEEASGQAERRPEPDEDPGGLRPGPSPRGPGSGRGAGPRTPGGGPVRDLPAGSSLAWTSSRLHGNAANCSFTSGDKNV